MGSHPNLPTSETPEKEERSSLRRITLTRGDDHENGKSPEQTRERHEEEVLIVYNELSPGTHGVPLGHMARRGSMPSSKAMGMARLRGGALLRNSCCTPRRPQPCCHP